MFLAATDHDPYPSWQRNHLGLGLIRAATVKARRPELVAGNHANVRVQLTKAGRELLWDEQKTWEEELDELAEGLVLHRYAGGPLYARPLDVPEEQNEVEDEVVAEEEEEEEEAIPAWVLAMSSSQSDANTHAQKEEGERAVGEGEDPEDEDPEVGLDAATLERLEEKMARLPAKADLPHYTELATFAADTEEEQDALMGATAIAYAPYGDGSVITISTHPESTFPEEVDPKWRPPAIPRMRRFIQRAVMAVANSALFEGRDDS